MFKNSNSQVYKLDCEILSSFIHLYHNHLQKTWNINRKVHISGITASINSYFIYFLIYDLVRNISYTPNFHHTWKMKMWCSKNIMFNNKFYLLIFLNLLLFKNIDILKNPKISFQNINYTICMIETKYGKWKVLRIIFSISVATKNISFKQLLKVL